MTSAILFDLDDTLIDRNASIQNYATILEQEFGSQLNPTNIDAIAETLIACDGGGYRPRLDVSVDIAQSLSWTIAPSADQIHAHWMEYFLLASVLRTHAIQLLDLLKSRHLPIGLVTNGSTVGQNRKVDTLGIRSYFSSLIVSETVGIKKPHPDIFQTALTQLQVAAKNTWFVGDHPTNDIIGAAQVGLNPIWIRVSHPWPESTPPASNQITRLDEIPEIIF